MGEVKRVGVLHFIPFVGAGAAVGTLLRALIEGAFPPEPGQWPWATFWINIVGSFVLGFLLEFLTLGGEDTGWRRTVRLGIGTGVIGGFTTYSTFVLEIDKVAQAGQIPLASLYALVSIPLGVAAAYFGLVLADLRHRATLARGAEK